MAGPLESLLDRGGPLGLSQDFFVNIITEFGGAILTAIFTAGLIGVARTWAADIARDKQRQELRTTLRSSLEAIASLGKCLAEFVPVEADALEHGDRLQIPLVNEAPTATDSVQLMAFLGNYVSSFSRSMRDYTGFIRIPLGLWTRERVKFLLRWIKDRRHVETRITQLLDLMDSNIRQLSNDLRSIEMERAHLNVARNRSHIEMDLRQSELRTVPYRDSANSIHGYAQKLAIVAWRYNVLIAWIREIDFLITQSSPRDSFFVGIELPDIEIRGKTPRNRAGFPKLNLPPLEVPT